MAEGDAELKDLYRDVLLDYYRSQGHRGKLENADFHSHGVNPICGDEVDLTMTRRNGSVDRIRYTGHGCVISQASTAMMAEALEGRRLDELPTLIEAFRGMLLRGSPAKELPGPLEEARAIEGVRKFPVRIKCALLPWNTLKLGLETAPSGKQVAEYQESER